MKNTLTKCSTRWIKGKNLAWGQENVFSTQKSIFLLQKNVGFTPQTRPEASRNPPPPPPPPAQAGPSSPNQPGKIPYFVPDPDNIPSQRIGNQNTRGSPPEDNFKYEKNPNFDEKLVVPKFYQGEVLIRVFPKDQQWESNWNVYSIHGVDYTPSQGPDLP